MFKKLKNGYNIFLTVQLDLIIMTFIMMTFIMMTFIMVTFIMVTFIMIYRMLPVYNQTIYKIHVCTKDITLNDYTTVFFIILL